MPGAPSRVKRKLSNAEIRALRDGVNAELSGYVPPEKVDISGVNYAAMPKPRAGDPDDLLTISLVRGLCEAIAEDHLNLETASQCMGIPPSIMEGYLKRGEADLQRGVMTRMAWFAVLVHRVEGLAKRAILKAISQNPLGWMNQSWRAERQWPLSFSVQRLALKNAQGPDVGEQLAKMLMEAAETGGAPLPRIDVETIARLDDVIVGES